MAEAIKAGGAVVSLAERRVVVDEDIIVALEQVLECARRGEYTSVFYFGFLQDGSSQTFYSASNDRFRDLALIERLKQRMLNGLDA